MQKLSQYANFLASPKSVFHTCLRFRVLMKTFSYEAILLFKSNKGLKKEQETPEYHHVNPAVHRTKHCRHTVKDNDRAVNRKQVGWSCVHVRKMFIRHRTVVFPLTSDQTSRDVGVNMI